MTIEIRPTPPLRALCFIGFLAMAAQLLLLAEPSFAVDIVDATWDKAIHFLFYGTMAFLLWVATAKRWPLAVWLTVAVIGAADETLQAYTPGRTSDIHDWIADGLGAAAALVIAQRLSPSGERAAARVASRTGGVTCAES
ncbi:MAG: VanZ family protein [Usitatibacter sp.]